MPQSVKRKVTGRTQVENQIKKPDFGVYARPTDPYEETFSTDQTAQVLGELGKLLQTGTEAAVPFAERARERGLLDQQAGKAGENDSTLFHSAYMNGVDTILGEDNANKLSYEATEAALKLREQGFDAVKGELDRLSAKYLAANPSKAAAQAFLPKSTVLVEKLLKQQKEYEIGQAKQELDSKTYNNMDTYYRNDVINGVLEPYGITTDHLLTEEGMQIFADNKEAIMAALGPALAAGNSAFQAKYAGVHSKQQISSNTVQILAGLAIMTGRKEFLEFAFQKQQGEDMPLSNRFDAEGNPYSKTLYAAQIRADNRKDEMSKELRIRRKEREEKEASEVAKTVVNTMRTAYKGEDFPYVLAEAEAEIQRYSQMPGADQSQVNTLYTILDTAKNRRHHPAASVVNVREDLAFLAARDRLTVAAVAASRWDLSPGDYDKLLGTAIEQESGKEKRKRQGTDAFFTKRNNVHIAWDDFWQTHNPKNRITGLPFDFQGEQNAVNARKLFQTKVIAWQEEHNGESPDEESLKKIIVDVTATHAPYKYLDAGEVEKVKRDMIEKGTWPKNLEDLTKKWGSLSIIEREAASKYFGN